MSDLPSAAPDRSPPHSAEAEEHVIATILLDNGETLKRAITAGLKPESFYFPANRLLFEIAGDLHDRSAVVDLATVAEELKTRRQLEAVGGFAYLMQVTGKIPTTAHAGYFIEKVREKAILREAIRTATGIVETAYGFTGGLDEFLAESQFRMAKLAPASHADLTARSLTSFALPPAHDPSILIGNRYISRGDIAILASTSGMGKSSLSLQMATHWALGQSIFGGFKPNGSLKSLIFQAEDGDGDIAEVQLSLRHAMNLTPEQAAAVGQNVLIVTDRIHRGNSFIAELKRQIAVHQPDIVWVNPLLAFLNGDVNDAKDIGTFLREQLNSLNEPAKFAYVIIHHTAKPPKERKERQWNEVMYEMAGSADLTNAARAVLALQASETQGEFKLIAAKRGQRAGLTELVPGTQNPEIKFHQPTSVITLRHSKDRFTADGQDLPVIHWERFDAKPGSEAPAPTKTGRKPSYFIEDFYRWIPDGIEKAMPAAQIFRLTNGATGITDNGFKKLLFRASEEGKIRLTDIPAKGPCYHR